MVTWLLLLKYGEISLKSPFLGNFFEIKKGYGNQIFGYRSI